MFGSLASSSNSSIMSLGSNLQRSRSFTASISSDASRNEYAPAIEAPDLGQFPPEVKNYIQACVSGTCRRLLSQSILAGFVCFCF